MSLSKTSKCLFFTLALVHVVLCLKSQTLDWVKSIGAGGSDLSTSIALDRSGNLYTTGSFRDTVDFDPGPGVSNHFTDGSGNIFILKMDTTGNFVWAGSMGGTTNDIGRGIAADNDNNVIIIGQFASTVDFDPGPGTYNLTPVGNTDIFVLKLDSNENFVWAHSFGTIGGNTGWSVTVDSINHIYITGQFYSTVDFDPGAGVANLSSNGSTDVFILKLDSAGNYIWARSFGGTGYDDGFGITVDPGGNIYTTGRFNGTVDFDPGPGTLNLTAAGGNDVFVHKLDSSGAFIWARA
ncbi:MAG: SBBP repeat-containing protein, partial [Bacteroidetes bacterium]|nr:SBBP repeat-containing protein [Bacteroidota bacterium]